MNRTKSTPKKRKTSTARTRLTNWRTAFIANLKETGIISKACQAAKIGRTTFYDERKSNEQFASQVTEALEDAGDLLEAEAWRRAVDGVVKPVFGSMGTGQGSGEIGSIREYSDTLLIFLLKGNKPTKFREQREVVGSGGGPVIFRVVRDERRVPDSSENPAS